MPLVNPLKESQRGWIDRTIAEIEYIVGKQKCYVWKGTIHVWVTMLVWHVTKNYYRKSELRQLDSISTFHIDIALLRTHENSIHSMEYLDAIFPMYCTRDAPMKQVFE